MTESRLRAIVTTLVGAIAALAFLVSFRAISQFAVQTGAFPHSLGWAAPLLVDSFTLAASIEVLRSAVAGQRAIYPWCLVAAATAASATLNIAHAPQHPAAQAVAGIPPVALLLALELLMRGARLYLGVHPGGQQAGAGHGPRAAAGLAGTQPVHPPDRPLGGRAAGRVPLPRRGPAPARTGRPQRPARRAVMPGAALPVATDHAGRLGRRGGLPACGLVGACGIRGARTGLACGAAPGDPEPRARTGRLPAGRAATWPPPASRALRKLRVPAGSPPAALDPAVIQEARRHRSPGAGEEQRPTSRQEARTVADQLWEPHPRRHLLTHPTRKEEQALDRTTTATDQPAPPRGPGGHDA